MQAVVSCILAVGLLAGCAASHPYVKPSPIPDEVGWSAAVVEPLDEAPPPPVITVPERKARPHELVLAFTEGEAPLVKVGVNYPTSLLLQPGEAIAQLMWGDRTPIAPGEEGESPWDIREGVSHSPPRPAVLINVTKPGLAQGITITTNRRIYLLDVRSVAASKVRLVRWDYGPEPVKVATKPRLLPDLTQPQTFYGGYTITAANHDRVPSWMPRQVVNDQQGKTYVVFPSYLTAIQAPLLRLIGNTGPEVINYRQVGTVYILDGLFNMAELKVGTGEQAEIVRISRGTPQVMRCPGDPACPVWPDVALAAGVR
jgi:type IV secretion system protein TrbG